MLTTVPGCVGSGSVEVLVRRALLSGVARVRSEGLLSPVRSVALPGCRSLARWVTVGRGLGSPGEIPGRLVTMVAMPAGICVLAGGTVEVSLPPSILLMPG
jgi:hypothetical protein